LLSLFIIVKGLLATKVKVEFFLLSFALACLKAFLTLLLAFTNAFLTFFLISSFKL
jgi:hypothetical protein